MHYFVSDIHGEYELFLHLLDKIGFSCGDTMYILGDLIDKGERSVELIDFVRSEHGFVPVYGNHEYSFIKYYHGLMRSCTSEADAENVLLKLRKYFQDGEKLSWNAVDYLESLPFYIEFDDFICVHAGVAVDGDGMILPLNGQLRETLVYDRNFKDEGFVLSENNKTVLFGHTPCSYANGTGEFIKTPKAGIVSPEKFSDYSKIRLDCGVFITGKLGALRLEDMREFYVEKDG